MRPSCRFWRTLVKLSGAGLVFQTTSCLDEETTSTLLTTAFDLLIQVVLSSAVGF